MAEPLWTSEEIARATGGTAFGAPFAASSIDIDSREIMAGGLFVALAAERDGHDFVNAALARDASGSLVSREVAGSGVRVADTLQALRDLGAASRDRAPAARRAAITGSVGKTTVTQLVLSGLQRAGTAHGSVRSFNNHIGVPLTLARMPRDTERAVFEMGMNHAGEIAPLSELVCPHVAAVTTVQAVHTENFPDGESGVARAKAEVFEGLERGGVAVLDAGNRWSESLAEDARSRGATIRLFGVEERAEARLTGFVPHASGAAVEAVLGGRAVAFTTRQSAPHWGSMSLCALLVMDSLDVELVDAIDAIEAFAPLEGRGAERRAGTEGRAFTLIDESYNASPASTVAALKALGARVGRRLAILTDMLELGPESEGRHAELSAAVEEAGIDLVFCAGPLMHALWTALPPSRRGAWAPTAEGLTPEVTAAVRDGDIVMVKGSKASKASLVLDALERL